MAIQNSLIRILCWAVSATSICSMPARAQMQRDTLRAIPRELVEGLLTPFNMGFPGANEFVVGDVPSSLKPFLHIPSGAKLIGGLTSTSGVYVVMTTSLTPTELAAEYRREQPKLGWTTPSTIGRTWGFVAAPNATSDNSGLQFCHINQSLEIRPMMRPGGTLVSIVVQNYGGRCNSNTVSILQGQNTPSLLPTLENPVGSTINSTSCFSPSFATTGPTSTSERVQTMLTPTQLMDAFAKQLSDSGYKSADASNGAVRRTWVKPDTGDFLREVTLQAIPTSSPVGPPIPGGCVDVSMNVRRVARPR